MDSILLQLEQQLTALSVPTSVPTSLLFTAASVVVISLTLVRTLRSRSHHSTSAGDPKHQQGGCRGDETALSALAGLPAPEQLSRLIQQRRSIFPKDYTGATVADSDLQMMLDAANWAPTHGKTEPWRFVVMGKDSSKEMLELSAKLAEENLPAEEWLKREVKVQAMRHKKLPQMSHIVALCMRRAPNAAGKLMPEWEDMCACACAVQNMQLMATSLGVACYWSSWWPEARDAPQFKSWLGLEPEDRCLGLLMVGCSAAGGSYRAVRGPIEEKVQWRQ